VAVAHPAAPIADILSGFPMFRFFENLVDPYQPYDQQDAPPTRLWPFLKDYVRPFKGVFAWTGVFSVRQCHP
jgi:hypothetical protein